MSSRVTNLHPHHPAIRTRTSGPKLDIYSDIHGVRTHASNISHKWADEQWYASCMEVFEEQTHI